VEKTLPKLIDDYDVDLLLFLGDVTEEKDEHQAELVNRVVRAFAELSELCPIVCLQGNHDWLSSPANPFFGFLGQLERIAWISRPIPLNQLPTVPEDAILPGKTLLLPHSANPDRDWAKIDFKSYDTVFAHQCFAGASSESGFQLGGVPLSYFPSKLKIIAGDIHKPQTLGNLTYVGAPYSVDFGDNYKPRVLIYDGKWTSVPVPGPQKRLIEIKKSILELEECPCPWRPGDILEVRVPVEGYDEWPKLYETLKNWATTVEVILHVAKPVIQGVATRKLIPEKRTSRSDKELLQEYGQKRKLADSYIRAGEKFL